MPARPAGEPARSSSRGSHPRGSDPRRSDPNRSVPLAVVAALFLAAVALRPQLLAIGPLLPLLREDLRALGHEEASLARLPRARLPELPGAPEALGAPYVMEVATLGGQLLLRHLRRHFEHVAAGDFVFFRAYGESVGPMWKSFGEALLSACPEPTLAPRVIRGAQDTFEVFENWIGEGHR